MEQRKEWRSLHLINRKVSFLGFRPLQWVIIACALFGVGFLFWWLALAAVPLLWHLGRATTRQQRRGHPDYLLEWVLRVGQKRYFVDHEGIFNLLGNDDGHRS